MKTGIGLNKMNLLVKFLHNNGFKSPDLSVPLSSQLEWISSLNSQFLSWLFERLETIPVLDDDEQIQVWNGLTTETKKQK